MKLLGNKSSAIALLILLLILLLVITGAQSVIWKSLLLLRTRTRTRTVTFYSASNDGYLFRWGYDDYEAIRGAESGDVRNTGRAFLIGQSDASRLNEFWILRGAVFFDTSSIPDKSTIVSVTLSLYGRENTRYGRPDRYGEVDFNIVIQNGQPIYPHEPMEPEDYYMGHYSGNGGLFNTSNFITTGYNDIPLNAQGISWINKTAVTKFCLRSDREINGEEPNEWGEVSVWASEKGSGYKPKLEVTYRIW